MLNGAFTTDAGPHTIASTDLNSAGATVACLIAVVTVEDAE